MAETRGVLTFGSQNGSLPQDKSTSITCLRTTGGRGIRVLLHLEADGDPAGSPRKIDHAAAIDGKGSVAESRRYCLPALGHACPQERLC